MRKFLFSSRLSRHVLASIFSLLPLSVMAAPKLYTVSYGEATQTLYYSGSISPLKNVPVISPSAGVVDQVYFAYGSVVKKGQKLLHINSKKLSNDLRNAKVSYLQAMDNYRKYQDWRQSDSVINAQDSLLRAKRSLTTAETTYQENQHLYKMGIIAKDTLEQSKNAVSDSKMNYQQQQRALQQTLEKGKGDSFLSVQLQMENAKEKYQSLQRQVDQKTVNAPATGIVLVPENTSSSGDDKSNGKVIAGSTISYQQVLMDIGDMSGLKIDFFVPEININQIKKGDVAVITGSAFPKVTLHGVVTEVAAQASGGGEGGGLPTFPVEVVVKKVTPDQAKWIRSGMDAQIAITVYRHNKALTVPVNAVSHDQSGKNVVHVYNTKTQTSKAVVVRVGKVLVDKAEILSGLTIGEKVVLPSVKT